MDKEIQWNVMALITVTAKNPREATDKAEEIATRCNALSSCPGFEAPVCIEVLDDVGGFYCPEPADDDRIPGHIFDREKGDDDGVTAEEDRIEAGQARWARTGTTGRTV